MALGGEMPWPLSTNFAASVDDETVDVGERDSRGGRSRVCFILG